MKKLLPIACLSFVYLFLFATPSFASGYYLYDASGNYLNRASYVHRDAHDPPKPFPTLIEDFDTWVFLSSVSGNANRSRPSFYTVSGPLDNKWLTNFRSNPNVWPWLAGTQPTRLNNLDEVINTFKSGYGIEGSVVWDGDKPFTLNVAATIAGDKNLVIVRRDSSLYGKITAAFPVKEDLTGRFNNKADAYNWAIDNYLVNKHNPLLSAQKDGDPLYLYKNKGVMYQDAQGGAILTWGNLSLDYSIAKRAFVFDLAPRSDVRPVDDFTNGADASVFERMLQVARQNTDTDHVVPVTGFPNEKYVQCNQFGLDYVQCGEWSFTQIISRNGGANRVGGGEWWGNDTPNFSFYNHGPGTDMVAQPAPLTPRQLLEKNYVIGFPYNYSFENDRNGGNWVLDTTNRVVYDGGGSQGPNFLEANVSDADLHAHNSIYQDIPLSFLQGYHYRFSGQVRSPSGGSIVVNQTLWAFRQSSGNFEVLCQNKVTISSRDWQTVSCETDIENTDYTQARLQFYLETPNTNYDFDEIYFDGPNTLALNPNKKFFTAYLGDYDYAAAVYVGTQVTPANIPDGDPVDYMPNWEHKGEFPAGWSFSSSISREIPPIYSYLAKTKTDKDWFIMPDSGAGYANPVSIPDQYVGSWIRETTNLHRQYGYRTGWILDGLDGYQDPWSNASGDRSRHMYSSIIPDGAIVSSALASGREFVGDYALTRLESFGWATLPFEGVAYVWTRDLEPHLSEKQFWAYRSVWLAPNVLGRVFRERIIPQHPEVTPVDPITYFELYKLSAGRSTISHSSIVSQNIPTYMETGHTYNVSLTIRNDGWDTWMPSGGNCGYGQAGKGCYVYHVGLTNTGNPDPGHFDSNSGDYWVGIDHQVIPGETTTFNLTINAPSNAGSYTLRTDMVKDQIDSFQHSWGDQPWQKPIQVTDRAIDFNNDGAVNNEEMDQVLDDYLNTGVADVNGDGVVNTLDLRKVANQSQNNP